MLSPSILVLIDYYLPGYKAGGPLRTIANMVQHLGEEFEFRILTRDRDATELRPYPNIKVNRWNQQRNSQVYYASTLGFTRIRQVVREISPDVIYLNSLFSPLTIRYLILRRLQLVPTTPTVLAPRGEFSPGALRLKGLKKRIFLKAALAGKLYHNLVWQASAEQEKNEIESVWPTDICIQVAPNMPPDIVGHEQNTDINKEPNSARFIFVSRITPKKNLTFALQLLTHLRGEVHFTIVGPIRDPGYWKTCENIISSLPKNVKVNYSGSVPHSQISDILQYHHFFLLPTLGENFGHAILEAMINGCPVLISDQTPWRALEQKKVGWDLPLEAKTGWLCALQLCVDMEQAQYDTISSNAKGFAADWITNSGIHQANIDLFNLAIGKK